MKTWLTVGLGILLMASTLALTLDRALAQERTQEEQRPERAGGIPRELVVPNDDQAAQEGTEEGLPSLRTEPGDRRVAPYVLPPEGNAWKLGVYARYTDTGVVVTRVVPGSPAQRVGLERGDRIVSVSGFQVGWIRDRLYPLDAELQRQGGYHGQVLLLVQNVRNQQLLNLDVRLERQGQPYRERGRTRRGADVDSSIQPVAPEAD